MMKKLAFLQKKGKLVTLLLAIVMVIGIAVGGTMAWLVAKTTPVVNTFTYGDINLTLTETDTQLDNDGDPNTNRYVMIPGTEIDKDPKATVVAQSVDCWLFVKLEKSDTFDTFMSYEIADGWTVVPGTNNLVYYREVQTSLTDQEFSVLKDDKVTVKEDVTREQFHSLTEFPTLQITSYAVQKVGFDTAEAAWVQAQN